MRHLPVDEVLRHDPDHLAARRERTIRNRAHEARATTTVHETSAALRQMSTHRGSLPDIRGIDARIGRAKDTDRNKRQLSARSSRSIPDIRCIAARRLGGIMRLIKRQNHIMRISRFSRFASAIIEWYSTSRQPSSAK